MKAPQTAGIFGGGVAYDSSSDEASVEHRSEAMKAPQTAGIFGGGVAYDSSSDEAIVYDENPPIPLEETGIVNEESVELLPAEVAKHSAGNRHMLAPEHNSSKRMDISDVNSFVDMDFPPQDSSLGSPEFAANYQVQWKRPVEFMQGEIKVFDNIEPNDIIQGQLGDCWFLCAVACLAEFPVLIQALFPNDNTMLSDSGMYTLKFCKDGQWRTVTVDDYFPCHPQGGPIFAASNGNELWAMLAEKAYAKLHGSYEAISGGFSEEAMEDMTGDPCVGYRFNDEDVMEMIHNGTLWNRLIEYDSLGYVLTVSSPGEDTLTMTGDHSGSGLVAGHAYSLIGARTLSNGEKIVLIRNPWGSKEWDGAWSDNSSDWTPELMSEVADTKYDFTQSDDGMFWMSYDDMIERYESISVCMCRTPGIHPNPWKELRKKSYFMYDFGNYSASPFSMMSIKPKQTTSAVVSIHQTDSRHEGSAPYIDIGVTILKVNSASNPVTYDYVASSGCTVSRQAAVEVPLLEKGCSYVVVPICTGGKFLQQINHSERCDELLFHGQELSKCGKQVVDEIFRRFDIDMDEGLGPSALTRFFIAIIPGISRTVAKGKAKMILASFDCCGENNLSLVGFRQALSSNCDKAIHGNLINMADKHNVLMSTLKALGYDNNLQLNAARSVVVVIHSDENISSSFLKTETDSPIYEEAMEQPIIHSGVVKQYDGLKLYKQKNGYCGVSFVAMNESSTAIAEVSMEIRGKNTMSYVGHLKRTVEIPPNEAKVLQHLMPDDSLSGWSYGYSLKHRSRPVESVVPAAVVPVPPIVGDTVVKSESRVPENSFAAMRARRESRSKQSQPPKLVDSESLEGVTSEAPVSVHEVHSSPPRPVQEDSAPLMRSVSAPMVSSKVGDEVFSHFTFDRPTLPSRAKKRAVKRFVKDPEENIIVEPADSSPVQVESSHGTEVDVNVHVAKIPQFSPKPRVRATRSRTSFVQSPRAHTGSPRSPSQRYPPVAANRSRDISFDDDIHLENTEVAEEIDDVDLELKALGVNVDELTSAIGAQSNTLYSTTLDEISAGLNVKLILKQLHYFGLYSYYQEIAELYTVHSGDIVNSSIQSTI